MKTKNMLRLTMCIFLIAVLSLSVGCSKGDTTSEWYSYVEDEVYVGGEGEATEDGSDANDDKTPTSSKKNNSSNKNNNNSSGNNSTSGGSGNTNNGGSTTELKGSTVKVLTWYKAPAREKSVSDEFTKKTGITIKYTVTSPSNYQTKLASLVASGASPDLAAIQSTAYPNVLVKGLFQPLDTKYYDLNDSVYDKSVMDEFKWGDKYYGVAVKGSMMGDFYVVYYNKRIFEEAGEETPYEIWKANPSAWTWEKFAELAAAVKTDKVDGFSCAYPRAFMLSTGEDFLKVSNGKITNNMKSSNVETAWKKMNEYKNQGLMKSGNAFYSDFIQGSVAMHINGQWFMQPDQSFATEMNAGDWGVAPFPSYNGKYTVPYSGLLWGNPAKAKNVEGAAKFIRYWLDPVNEVKSAPVYANAECREVHTWIWNQVKSIDYSSGIIDFKASGTYNEICNNLMGGENAVKPTLDSYFSKVSASIDLVQDENQ